MTAKDYKVKWEEAAKLAAGLKFEFSKIKHDMKNLSFSEKRVEKKKLKEVRFNLRKAQKDVVYYRRQYVLLSKADGKHISTASVVIDEIKSQLSKKKK